MGDLGDAWVRTVLRDAFAGLESEDRWEVAAAGVAGDRAGAWLSGASLASSFQIGSVTKTFTALLLATMVVQGRVALEDPLRRYLPAAGASGIRLVDLATHTSGYPRVPRSIKARMLFRLRDPYALVRDRHIDSAVRKLSPGLGPGPHPFEYSNFGYGVLSRALASAAGRPFGQLLREEVLGPLGLSDEVVLESDPDPGRRRVFGHSTSGQELEHWHNPALPGASFLFSSIEGMGRYLIANLRPAATKLRSALDLTHQPLQLAEPGTQAGLGWLVRATEDGPLYWHNGGTSGFGAFIGFDLSREVGVAALMSRRHLIDLDEAAVSAISVLGRHRPA